MNETEIVNQFIVWYEQETQDEVNQKEREVLEKFAGQNNDPIEFAKSENLTYGDLVLLIEFTEYMVTG